MTRAKSSWICWPSAIREPIRVRRVNHLSRRSFGRGGISHQPPGQEVFGVFWKDGSDWSITTHGNLSSRKIAFCGANDAGSSSDAIVHRLFLNLSCPRKTCRNMRQRPKPDSRHAGLPPPFELSNSRSRITYH